MGHTCAVTHVMQCTQRDASSKPPDSVSFHPTPNSHLSYLSSAKMDFEDDFPSAPTRYAFDDSDDSETEQEVQEQQPVAVNYAPGSSVKKTLVIGLKGAGSVLLNALNGEKRAAGVVVVPVANEAKKPSVEPFPILELASPNLLLLPCNAAVSIEQTFAWAKTTLEGLPDVERVIVLDTFMAADYITATARDYDLQPPCLRVLHTSAAPPAKNLTLYEPPNLAKNLSAAILSHAEVYSIPAYLLLSLQESSYGKTLITDETLGAFVDGLRVLGIGGVSVDYGRAQQEAKKLGSKLDGHVDQHHHRLYL